MPEGHTIHRLARDHERWFAGGPVRVTSPQGRFEAGADVLDGRVLREVDAWGKHLFYHFERGPEAPRREARAPGAAPAIPVLHVHLGLFGRFRMRKRPAEPRGTPRMVLGNDEREVRLSGPTACELLTRAEVKALRARLGPDPLRNRAPGKRFVDAVVDRRRAAGAVLLDQSVIAGIGNVYRSELLFRIGVDPRTPCREVPPASWRRLWDDARSLLDIGVKLNRIVTVDPPERGRRTVRQLVRGERVYVYRRPTCLRCDTRVQTGTIGQRKAYWCPRCQAAP